MPTAAQPKSRVQSRSDRVAERDRYRALPASERRRERRVSERERRRTTPAPKPKQPPFGPPLGQGQAFDHDPNTMFSYFNPPQQFDFSDDMTPGNFNDPFNQFLASLPIQERETKRAIGESMAGAGFSGNRYGGDAMRAAGEIGAASGERQNAAFNAMMSDFANQQLDRQMRAAEGYINAAPQVEDAMMGRFGINMQLAQQEQQALDRARAEANANRRAGQANQWRQYEATKYGNLPFLTRFLSNDLGDTPNPILRQNPGKEGGRETAMDLAQILAAMYASGN